MKKIIISFVIFFMLIYSISAKAQCADFVKKGLTKLDTTVYLHDGRVNAISLSEGDNIDVYKPFYKDRNYRIVVLAENLSGVTFKIVDTQKKVIFNSAEKHSTTWDYTPEKNQNLIITVQVPKVHEDEGATGCVAVIIGYKKAKK